MTVSLIHPILKSIPDTGLKTLLNLASVRKIFTTCEKH